MSQKTIIEPKKNYISINFRELFQFRELILALVLKDIKVRYAQTAVGIAWGFLNPILTLLILNFAFGIVADIPTGDTPHAVFTIAGLCGWTYFATVTSTAGSSIINSQDLVKKVYFPRLIIPLSKAVAALIDFGIIFICLIGLMLIYGIPPSGKIIFLPLFVLMVVISALTAGIWISALTIRFRDFLHITPFLLRLGLFITPIAYPFSMVPEKFQFLYILNPMVGVVEGIRWSILGGPTPSIYLFASFAIILILFYLALIYFQKMEEVMADII